MFDPKQSRTLSLLHLVVLLAILGPGCESGEHAARAGLFSVEAPATRLATLDGGRFDLKELRGQVVLLNFWATFCPPCREEMPDFEALHRDYRSKGLAVVGISLDSVSPDRVRQFLESAGVTYPVAMGRFEDLEKSWGALANLPTYQGRGTDPPVADNGSVYYIPATFVIDRRGRIVEKHVGGRTRDQLEPVIRKLLGSEPPAPNVGG